MTFTLSLFAVFFNNFPSTEFFHGLVVERMRSIVRAVSVNTTRGLTDIRRMYVLAIKSHRLNTVRHTTLLETQHSVRGNKKAGSTDGRGVAFRAQAMCRSSHAFVSL